MLQLGLLKNIQLFGAPILHKTLETQNETIIPYFKKMKSNQSQNSSIYWSLLNVTDNIKHIKDIGKSTKIPQNQYLTRKSEVKDSDFEAISATTNKFLASYEISDEKNDIAGLTSNNKAYSVKLMEGEQYESFLIKPDNMQVI